MLALRWTLLGLITAAAAWLRLAHLGQVPGNPFYDAAVHTMATSWHAFLFGALDPSGGVSVDKPPVDLWAQVASVKLFGFNPAAIKLPQALAGTASVGVLFDLVRRSFGWTAGLAAAAALAVLPVAVLTARSDTMDTFMSLLVLVAVWCAAFAVQRRQSWWLLAAGAAFGLAFNVKLFQAFVVVPALVLLWLAGSRGLHRRLLAPLAAALVAIVVGIAWIVPVALTPASQRPYPIGSTNGSIWNLVFVFNGIDRLHGRPLTTPDTLPAGSRPSAAIVRSQQRRAHHLSRGGGPGLLFGRRFATLIGAELFPALVLLAALAVAWLVRRRRPRAARAGARRLDCDRSGALQRDGVVPPALLRGDQPGGRRSGRRRSLRAGAARRPAGAAAGRACAGRKRRLRVADHEPGGTRRAGRVHRGGHRARRSGRAQARQRAGARGHRSAVGRRRPDHARRRVARRRPQALVRRRALGRDAVGWPQKINSYLRAHRNGTRYAFASVAPAKAAP